MISVLIPFRGDGAQRDRLWAHCRNLWAQLPVELVVGEDSGDAPFNVSRAFNDAASRASGDIFMLYGADQLPDLDRILWASEQLETHAWCALYAGTGAYSQASTEALLNGYGWDRAVFDQWAPFCTGILAVTRETWADVNGMDERFFGWGCEDVALRVALTTLHGDTPEPSGNLRCLWHPAASRERFDANAAMIGAYDVAASDPELMRELIAGNR
jgi:hypothetical protein